MTDLHNFPQPLNKEDYEKVCQLTVADLKKNPDVLAVYLFGDEWTPGISDLDIIVVYKNQPENRIGIKAPWQLSKKAQSIFIHRYENYNQRTFFDRFYLYPYSENLKLLFGQPLAWRFPQEELSQKEYHWLQTAFLFDLLINKLLLIFRYKFKERINIREAILVISSLRHTLRMANEIVNSELAIDFSSKIEQLRTQWFKKSRRENIKTFFYLLEEAEKLVLKLIKELDSFLKKEVPNFVQEIREKKFSLRNPKYDLLFIPHWQENTFLEGFKRGLIKFNFPFSGRREDLDSYRLVLPNSLFFFLAGYLKENGPLSDWLKNGMKDNYSSLLLDRIHFNKGFQEHVRAVNNYVTEGINFKGESLKLWFSYGFFPYRRSTKRKIIDLIILLIKKFK